MINSYWNDLIKRLCHEANKYLKTSKDTATVITVKVIVYDNKPVAWTIENSCKIEPAKMVQGLLNGEKV